MFQYSLWNQNILLYVNVSIYVLHIFFYVFISIQIQFYFYSFNYHIILINIYVFYIYYDIGHTFSLKLCSKYDCCKTVSILLKKQLINSNMKSNVRFLNNIETRFNFKNNGSILVFLRLTSRRNNAFWCESVCPISKFVGVIKKIVHATF